MNDKRPHIEVEEAVSDRDTSATEQLSHVVDDVRALAKAELAYVRARFDYSSYILQRTAGYGAIAVFAFSCATIALVVGLIMTLIPLLGPGWTTLVVTLGFLIVSLFFAMQARNWIMKISPVEKDRNDDHA